MARPPKYGIDTVDIKLTIPRDLRDIGKAHKDFNFSEFLTLKLYEHFNVEKNTKGIEKKD